MQAEITGWVHNLYHLISVRQEDENQALFKLAESVTIAVHQTTSKTADGSTDSILRNQLVDFI